MNFLGQLSHCHLVRLVGYCLEDEHRMLVYEFMPRGSLENHLFRSKYFLIGSLLIPLEEKDFINFRSLHNNVLGGSYFQPLSWSLRLKVALGAAKGLAFLHSDERKVIYRDFKTSNILLDSVSNCQNCALFRMICEW